MFCKFIWHNLTIVTCQWYVLSYGSNNCVFSCYLVEGLRVLAKQQSCSIVFLIRRTPTVLIYGELNCSYLRRTPTVLLYVELKTVLVTANSNCSCLRRTQRFSCSVELKVFYSRLKVFYSRLKVFYSTLQQDFSTPSASFRFCRLTSWKVPVSGPFIKAYIVKSSVILYSSLCSRTSLYPESGVYSHSTLLCRLWTLHYSATLKYCCAC